MQGVGPDEAALEMFRSQEEHDRYMAAKNKYSTNQEPPKTADARTRPGAETVKSK